MIQLCRRVVWGSLFGILLGGSGVLGQPLIIGDDFEASGTISTALWPLRSGGTVESTQPFFGTNNQYLRIRGGGVKVLSADWSQQLLGRITTFAFDYYEPSTSGDYLVTGYADGTDINTAGAFVRISLEGGLISLNGTTGVVQTASGTRSYPRDRRLTFSLILNDSAVPQPLENSTADARTMEVWYYDWTTKTKTFALAMSVAGSPRSPTRVGFRTWSTSTNADDYVDNVKLIFGAVIVDPSYIPAEVPAPMPIPPRPFVHPSVFNSSEDLQRLKYRINHEPSSAAAFGWSGMLGSGFASLAYQQVPYSNVVVMASGTTPSESQFRRDAHAARALALRWIITGDTQYRDKARSILNDWAAAFVTMSPASGTSSSQIHLEAAWAAPIWVAAADLIRYYNQGAGGWDAASITRFDTMLDYLYGQSALAANLNNNWGASAALAMIAIGVYQEDRARFDAGIQTWRSRMLGINAAVDSYNDDSINEVCRDTTHPQYTLQVWMQAAEIAWKHGVDLYGTTFSGETQPQFAKNLEFFAELFLGLRQPPCSASFLTNYNYLGEQQRSGAYDLAYNHYVIRSGLTWMTNYADLVVNHWRPGGFDEHFCGWSTMTHGDLSASIPAVSDLNLWDLSQGAAVGELTNGTTLNLRSLGTNYSITAACTGVVASVQFYTNGVLFGGPAAANPFLTPALPLPGTYFLSAVPSTLVSSGTIPGDPFLTFLRVIDLPAYWQIHEIGFPAIPAWAQEAAGKQTVAAAGTGIAGTADQFGFVSAAISGDLQITARLIDLQGGTAAARAGIMVRAGPSSGASNALLSLAPAGPNRLSWQCRAASDGSSALITNLDVPAGPIWLRLLRLGETFTTYYSADGSSWIGCASTNLAFAPDVQVGLAVASGSSTNAAQARFDNVLIEPLTPSYSQWQEWLLTRRGAAADRAAQDADPDGDHRPNLFEYWLGTDPLQPDSWPPVRIIDVNASRVRLQLRERKNAAAYGRVFLRSPDLQAWTQVTPATTTNLLDFGAVVLREITFPVGSAAAFYRSSYGF